MVRTTEITEEQAYANYCAARHAETIARAGRICGDPHWRRDVAQAKKLRMVAYEQYCRISGHQETGHTYSS